MASARLTPVGRARTLVLFLSHRIRLVEPRGFAPDHVYMALGIALRGQLRRNFRLLHSNRERLVAIARGARGDYDGRSLTRATRISWATPARTTCSVIDSPIG